ncbi:hypothetical protein, partial [Escherichia coli]|uniref:hypothetical protein n=1 Tax=Escherichia coli TaxID=562 RepID=UPI001BE3EF38
VPWGTVVALLASTPAAVRVPAMLFFMGWPVAGVALPSPAARGLSAPVVSITSVGSLAMRAGGVGAGACCGGVLAGGGT